MDKHTLVKHLRITFQEVVAVTGDGTNELTFSYSILTTGGRLWRNTILRVLSRGGAFPYITMLGISRQVYSPLQIQ